MMPFDAPGAAAMIVQAVDLKLVLQVVVILFLITRLIQRRRPR